MKLKYINKKYKILEHEKLCLAMHVRSTVKSVPMYKAWISALFD